MTTIRDATYDLLRAHGMTTIFGNPGSNELPFLAGIPDDFEYVLGLHEGAVIAMADGYAQASGRAAFVNLHAAAGTGNAMGPLTNSVYSHSPLVITAGQQVRATVGQEVMLANVDATSLTKPLVKWSCEPACAEDVPRSISQAIHIATLPAQGPVYVSVPYDDWAKEAPAETRHLQFRSTTAANSLDEAQLASLVDALDNSVSPVLVLGPQIDAERANAAAVELAEALDAPVWVAPSPSRCPFPTRHRSFRGVLPAAVQGITDTLDGHDLILVIGAPVFRYHQYAPGAYLPDGARLIHLTSDQGEAARAPMGDAIVCGIRDTVSRLAVAVARNRRTALSPLPDFADPRTGSGQVHPEELFALMRVTAPNDVVYVKESTSTTGAFWSQMDLSLPGSFYFPAAGGLGFGLPASVGVQLAHPGRQVVGIIGDGSANFGITGLWTAAQMDIPVIVVILKNGTYGALRWFSTVLDSGDTPGMDVPGIDFCSLATGYGVAATSVRTGDDFVAAFKNALASGRPAVIEVETCLTEP
ncbi:MAG: benzoylformate decarboxylase [Rhodococcus sp. (in: high G+C Gram-positive bacteria)]